MTAISHSTNPWRTDAEVNVLQANTVGKNLKEDFIRNRLGYASTKCVFRYAETKETANYGGQ